MRVNDVLFSVYCWDESGQAVKEVKYVVSQEGLVSRDKKGIRALCRFWCP